MAHTCPECGQTCYCSGDFDDIDFGEWYGCKCECWTENDNEDDEDDWRDDEVSNPSPSPQKQDK